MQCSRLETFEPETLSRLGCAFDEVWAAIAPSLRQLDDEAKAAARVRLAAIMLELTRSQLADDRLKQRALIIFHRNSHMAPSLELNA